MTTRGLQSIGSCGLRLLGLDRILMEVHSISFPLKKFVSPDGDWLMSAIGFKSVRPLHFYFCGQRCQIETSLFIFRRFMDAGFREAGPPPEWNYASTSSGPFQMSRTASSRRRACSSTDANSACCLCAI